MRWSGIIIGLICVAVLACATVSGAQVQPVPDYHKILKVHLVYQVGSYSMVSNEVQYGKAPRLSTQSGPLRGILLDTTGKELTTFSFRDPGTAIGDIVGSQDGDVLIGYTEPAAGADLIVTLPYLPDMQTFNIIDTRTGSPVASADLAPGLTAFCSDYPADPDCINFISSMRPAPVLAYDMSLVYATLFSAAVIAAAFLSIMTIRKQKASPQTAPTPERQSVLIVDDDPDIAHLINVFLDRKGYEPIIAASGPECLDILKTKKPDVILLDVRMEPMDGWQTLEQIKKNPDTKGIPVLMLTGKMLTAAEAQQFQICIDDYIMKPFQQADLYEAIGQVIDRKKKVKETLLLAKQAGVNKDKVCELATLSRRISVNKKILNILIQSHPVPAPVGELSQDTEVIRQIGMNAKANEERLEQLKSEIRPAFNKKGLKFPQW
jgi:CheY-like chemotaxis protein